MKATIGKKVHKWIEEAGYESVSEFARRTDSPVSAETIRRAISTDKASTWTIFLVLASLGKRAGEIKKELTAEGDKLLAPYLGKDIELPDHEKAFLTALQKIIAASSDELKATMVGMLELMARASNVSIAPERKILDKWLKDVMKKR